MHLRSALPLSFVTGIVLSAAFLRTGPAIALEPERYTVYCADDRIEISFWDLEQMKVRRGSDVCQFTSYTSYSDAIRFAAVNFGGEGQACTC